MALFDTHAHLLDPRFDEDRAQLTEALPENGVAFVLNVGCEGRRQFKESMAYAEAYAHVYAAIGVHPHEALHFEQSDLDAIRALHPHPKLIGIGEAGLDYHYDFAPKEKQREVFALQLALAQELGLPAILHIREAFGDAMDVLKGFGKQQKGVLHCFSGSYEFARQCIDKGYYVSFAGPLTFDNANRLRDVAARLPKDRVVVETDCPYLAPAPKRGRRNEPKYVAHTARMLAKVWGMEYEETADKTTRNALALFGLQEAVLL
jgi:TatD DNase family protein